MTVYPYALRVSNFVAASDAPLTFDQGRWRTFLTPFRLEGRPLFDAASSSDRALLEQVLARAAEVDGRNSTGGIETRGHMLARLADTELVTDDNMRVEWR